MSLILNRINIAEKKSVQKNKNKKSAAKPI